MTASKRSRILDTGMYIAIGSLTAAQTYAATGDISRKASVWIGIVLGGLVAWKAKRSSGRGSDTPNSDNLTSKQPNTN